MFLPLPILLARQILLSIHVNIHFSSRNPAAHHPRNLQSRSDSKRRHSFFQDRRRNSGIHQRAQKHIAAHAGKTLEVGYAHRKTSTCDNQRLIFHHREGFLLRQTSAYARSARITIFLHRSEGSLVSSSRTCSRRTHRRLSSPPLSRRNSAQGGHRTASEGRARRFRHPSFSFCQAAAHRSAQDC